METAKETTKTPGGNAGKTLYLHIGMPKTATTSIQRFLQANRDVLEKYGYCYPRMPYKYEGRTDERNAHFMIGQQYREDGSRDKALEKECLINGMAAIMELFDQFDNVILTDEALWRSSKTRPHLFPYLKKHAANHGYRTKIIVYLRRQDEYEMSLWKQKVKHPAISQTIPYDLWLKRVLAEEPFIFEYASRLDEIAAYFGKENIIVRRFDRSGLADWKNGSIIDDFLDCIGLERTPDFEMPEKESNPSLSENQTEIKRIINKDEELTPDELSYFSSIMRRLAPDSARLYPASLMSADEIRALLDRFAEENRRTADEYIRDGRPLFSDDVRDLPKWQPDNPYMLEDTIRVFASAVTDLRRENEKLRKELEAMRHSADDKMRRLQHDLDGLGETVKSEQRLFRMFKYKIKHPLRALFSKIFKRGNELSA